MSFKTKTIQYKADDVSFQGTEKTSAVIKFSETGSLDRDGDVIMKGAFTRSFNAFNNASKAKQRIMIRHLKNHDRGDVRGIPQRFWAEGNSIYFETQKIPNSFSSNDLFAELAEGLIDGHSHGFNLVEDKFEGNEHGGLNIHELHLREVSTLTGLVIPAHPNTRVDAVKQLSELPIDELLSLLKETEKRLKIGSLSDQYLSEIEIINKNITNILATHSLKKGTDSAREIFKEIFNI